MSSVFRVEIVKVRTVAHKTYDTYIRNIQRGANCCRNSDVNFKEELFFITEYVQPVNKC
jgi:hypothetical protein